MLSFADLLPATVGVKVTPTVFDAPASSVAPQSRPKVPARNQTARLRGLMPQNWPVASCIALLPSASASVSDRATHSAALRSRLRLSSRRCSGAGHALEVQVGRDDLHDSRRGVTLLWFQLVLFVDRR